MKRDSIDFHQVPQHQREMDNRLANWARWCMGSYRPETNALARLLAPTAASRGHYILTGAPPVDTKDAGKIAKGVAELPEKHRLAVSWHYIRPVNPSRARKQLGVTLDGLQRLVIDGRQMLINRAC